VGQLVALEVAGFSEGLGAMLTCMGLLPRMDSGVFLEATSCIAGIVTHLAPEWFLSSMDSCVCLEVTSLSAGIVAHLTLVWLHPCMSENVPPEVSGLSKRPIALQSTYFSSKHEYVGVCYWMKKCELQKKVFYLLDNTDTFTVELQ
jgi:hypothetical protein